MSRVIVHEQVDVNANFGPEGITPRAFRLHGHTVRVTQVHQRWQGRHGATRLHYFTVTAAERPYTLCFNADDGCWMLKEHTP
jgi:hypothetical protein